MLIWHDYEKEYPEPEEKVLCYYDSIGKMYGGVYRMRKANKFGLDYMMERWRLT